MTNLRHEFITGKRWVGIAAVNITNLSLRQKAKVYLDPSKLFSLSAQESKFVKDLSMVLPHNTINIDGDIKPSEQATLGLNQTCSKTNTINQKELTPEQQKQLNILMDLANKLSASQAQSSVSQAPSSASQAQSSVSQAPSSASQSPSSASLSSEKSVSKVQSPVISSEETSNNSLIYIVVIIIIILLLGGGYFFIVKK
jgi:hypothetical protein